MAYRGTEISDFNDFSDNYLIGGEEWEIFGLTLNSLQRKHFYGAFKFNNEWFLYDGLLNQTIRKVGKDKKIHDSVGTIVLKKKSWSLI